MKKNASPSTEKALFKFAANTLEDLGVNLYNSTGKALVEFVANAWDAYATRVTISFDPDEIAAAKQKCKSEYNKELKAAGSDSNKIAAIAPLETRCIETAVSIVIVDDGDGMNRDELEDKFLVVGRRRRKIAELEKPNREKRPIMGRKGLGKLAGFGIAHRVTVTSRAEGDNYSTRITLDYDELVESKGSENGIPVPTDILRGPKGLGKKGTRIELTKLVYQTISSDPENGLSGIISRNFGLIRPTEFGVYLNETLVEPEPRNYQWAYPVEEDRPNEALIPGSFTDSETGKTFNFRYRFRFTGEADYLQASDRGVRVYAHNRLASKPSMLGLGTSPRGFRYADYLDGVIEADFVDLQPVDLIATDRSDLRWDVPPLADFRAVMGDKLKDALKTFAEFREEKVNAAFKNDEFTKATIDRSELPAHRKKLVRRFAKQLAKSERDGLQSSFYRETVREIVSAFDHGDILSAIHTIAKVETPELPSLVRELTRLTQREFGEFLRFIQARLVAIEALRKLTGSLDFKAANNEARLHDLFRNNPWLINPQYFEWLTSNRSLDTLAGRIEEHLKIGKRAPTSTRMDTRRPDLVSVIANASLGKVVIIELKAENIPLNQDHLEQLKDYIADTVDFVSGRLTGSSDRTLARDLSVEGILIGTLPTSKDGGKLHLRLLRSIKEAQTTKPPWRVTDLLTILEETDRVHREFVSLHNELKATGQASGEEDDGE